MDMDSAQSIWAKLGPQLRLQVFAEGLRHTPPAPPHLKRSFLGTPLATCKTVLLGYSFDMLSYSIFAGLVCHNILGCGRGKAHQERHK